MHGTGILRTIWKDRHHNCCCCCSVLLSRRRQVVFIQGLVEWWLSSSSRETAAAAKNCRNIPRKSNFSKPRRKFSFAVESLVLVFFFATGGWANERMNERANKRSSLLGVVPLPATTTTMGRPSAPKLTCSRSSSMGG